MEPYILLPLSILIKSKKGCIPVCDRLIHSNNSISAINKWSDELKINLDIKTDKIFQTPFSVNKDSMLQWFQTRINHCLLGTNCLFEKNEN